ncbi:MAG: metal-dependent hydrolase [Nevskia sp.]|nr:metal-dependent hydrolase [Nevskia sp.]
MPLKSVLPIRRDLKFKLPANRLKSWHPDGVQASHFFNALSIFFPSGERFFIDSVRYYRDRGAIKSEDLLKAVTAFIGQEAMHGREHEALNEALTASGLPADRMERIVINLLEFGKKTLPPASRLAITIALEHFTAILADVVLRNPELNEGAEPRYTALIQWHALEETEHKAVAFDVYQAAIGKGPAAYTLRVTTLVIATIILYSLLLPFHFELVRREGAALDLRGWGRLFRTLWLKPGIMRKMVPLYFDYFRPGFHPWQHDNREFLAALDAIASEYCAAA